MPLLIWNEKRHIWETPNEKADRERNERYQQDRRDMGDMWQQWADVANSTAAFRTSHANTHKLMDDLLKMMGDPKDGTFRYSQDL